MKKHLNGKGYFLEFIRDFGDMFGGAIIGYQLAPCIVVSVPAIIVGSIMIGASLLMRSYLK